MTASGLEKSDLGKNRFFSALNMPYQNGKIIGAKRVRSFIGYNDWQITLQLPLDTLASLCKLIADWLSGPVVVCASFTCQFLKSYAVDVMDNTVLAEPLLDYQKRKV